MIVVRDEVLPAPLRALGCSSGRIRRSTRPCGFSARLAGAARAARRYSRHPKFCSQTSRIRVPNRWSRWRWGSAGWCDVGRNADAEDVQGRVDRFDVVASCDVRSINALTSVRSASSSVALNTEAAFEHLVRVAHYVALAFERFFFIRVRRRWARFGFRFPFGSSACRTAYGAPRARPRASRSI